VHTRVAPAVDAAFIEERLDRYGTMVRARMLEYFPRRGPRRNLYDLVTEYPLRPSKMLRSAICLASCAAHGGDVEEAVDTAVAIEFIHNAFMIHDDIEDDSDERRGRPSLHVEHGVPLALNVGDAMSFLSLTPLLENARGLGIETAFEILHEFARVVARTIEGQAIELGWIHDGDVDIDESDYLEMVLLKTCWYTTILPSRAGKLVATGAVGGDDFVRFGTYFGSSFQIRDDVLNLIGGEAYGKEIGGDIHEGKRTMMLVHLLRSCTAAERDEVIGIYRAPREERRDDAIRRVVELMHQYGSIERAASGAHGLAGAALAEFERDFDGVPDSDDRRFLHDLVLHLVNRSR
jgi:geranylgeranyl diphosphate synthase type II